jgi:cholesterol oxidase
MLSTDWKLRRSTYDFVVIGSGYGGAIAAARIATATLKPRPSLCMLERGRDWPVGTFPDRVESVLAEQRSDLNPLGLYELLNYKDISVIKGSGLGGTSLVNANVGIIPDPDLFRLAGWPLSLTYDVLYPYYERARQVLNVNPHPRAKQLAKVQALDRRARQLGEEATALNIAVNFALDGINPYGVQQKPCTDCGDCITGCNVGAKNTLYMNYLPMAQKAGAEIYTQAKVEWVEKLPAGGWRVHGRYYPDVSNNEPFTLDARNVILAAGSINSTEILLRSEMHGLPVSPVLGTGFSGNGDFFGLSYNGEFVTNVLGYGRGLPQAGESTPPGPTIVGIVRYGGAAPAEQRFAVEDLSFPSAYVLGAKATFAVLQGEKTVTGNEDAQRQRVLTDADTLHPYAPDGALNHTMLYLAMGHDDARGTMVFDAPSFEPDGRMTIQWDEAGRQIIFTRINEEVRRHARALGANFISNPLWSIFNTRHLITAHPLGGCPMGEDYLHGSADEYGRVFSGDGSIHSGLLVCDGSLIPSALNVNPLLTISALAERIAERKIRELQGEPYPTPSRAVSLSAIAPLEVLSYSESQLEPLFRRCSTLAIEVMVNQGGPPQIDPAARTIKNDKCWKGFFPKGHILNAMSSALFTGFKKEFHKQGDHYVGVTSDTDDRIHVRNSLEEISLDKPTGTLDAGKYILLRYLDAPWTGFYDIFKVINDNLLIGRVYLGEYPNGLRLFTFPMTREYGFDQMTLDDHAALYKNGSTLGNADLNGVWRMDVISNANHAGATAYLEFDLKPDGRLESRYQLMGLMEGLVMPSITQDHFQLNDFSPFHDEIRKVSQDFMVGRYVTGLTPVVARLFGSGSLGIFHTEPDGQFGFYYMLSRTTERALPVNRLLQPFLDVSLPDGLSMTFDEEMVGWYWEGASTSSPDRAGDLTIAGRIPLSGTPPGAVDCKFNGHMTAADINEFLDGAEHEASISGTISFGRFQGEGPVTFTLDAQNSRFNYLRVNTATGEAEMRYHLEFRTDKGRAFTFEGWKYMQKDEGGGWRGMREVLDDYTTLYCHAYERRGDQTLVPLGIGYMKFRTFEDLAAVGSLAAFLASFKVTGTDDPLLRLQAQMRFLAFTAQFVQREYDPLAPDIGRFTEDVRADVLRGASVPDYFSTRATTELQAALHDTPTQPLEKLVNTGAVHIDFDNKRIFRDSFWKGSFAKDTLLGWEERIRKSVLGDAGARAGAIFAGGSFWKRFDKVEAGVATGYVVNYELDFLPGLPSVRQVAYPDDNRRYFRKGDSMLLLNYTNDPYKQVYDTFKVIDANNAIGVMHLGDFPNGIAFATFVMARNNYPFENMSVEDHNLIFSGPHTSVPAASQLEGQWKGHLIFVTHPNSTLLNQLSPVLFELAFRQTGTQVECHYRFGLVSGASQVNMTNDFVRLTDPTGFHDEIRMIDQNTLIGKWVSPELSPALADGLRNYLEPAASHFAFYCILTRASS